MRDLMDPDQEASPRRREMDGQIDELADQVSSLGYDIVEIAGFIDLVDEQSKDQRPILEAARIGADRIQSASATVLSAIEAITSATEQNLAAVQSSVDVVHASSARTQSVAEWVQSLDSRMNQVSDQLKKVQESNGAIKSIASQVNILAINAKIEAARAGDAGRGFAVVAEAVNELSQKTSRAAESILESLKTLTGWIDVLRTESETVAAEATHVLTDSEETDTALGNIAENVRSTHTKATAIVDEAQAVRAAGHEFGNCFARIETAVSDTSESIHVARQRINALIDKSEGIVQQTVYIGGGSSDAPMIRFVQDQADEIARLFEQAVAAGDISQQALFDCTYEPIPGTDPQQFTTPFLALTDRLLPPILEGALKADPKVVFCAAVTPHGYLPTHNRKFSLPQRPGDPAWNAGNCRNRRMFNDRVGLKAGQNRNPFLLQIYRRDMGGGEYKMMKDLSAPITVDGKHWGGLRMGISF